MAEQMLAEVEYRDIPFVIDGYRVGSDGTIWSRWEGSGFGLRLGTNWRKLKLQAQREGHLHFSTRLRGREHEGQKHILVHRTVLECFVGPCPDGMECCHDDGNPQNNNLDNLRWDTPRANQADRLKHGTSNRGSQSPAAKLNEEQVKEILLLLANGKTQIEIAGQYGVCTDTIGSIHRRINWTHVTLEAGVR